MGTSLGGFLTLSLETELPRVALNPCMEPSDELPKLEPRPGHPKDVKPSQEMIETYKAFEEGVNHGGYNKSPKIIGLFAENDELLGTKYKNSFKAYYDDARKMPGGHHGNKEAIPAIVQAIKDITGYPSAKASSRLG